jgi:hypothetical protein
VILRTYEAAVNTNCLMMFCSDGFWFDFRWDCNGGKAIEHQRTRVGSDRIAEAVGI